MKIFRNEGIARTLKISEPLTLRSLKHTFEGALLFSLVSDDAPCARSSDDKRMYLGSDEFWGEGHLMFAGDLTALRKFIALGKTSNGRCASILVPALERELVRVLDNPNSPCSIDMTEIQRKDRLIAIGIPEILQDLLIQHPDLCDDDHFTVTGHYGDGSDPDHLGGYAFFVTANEVEYQATDEWLMLMRIEHRCKRVRKP
jgi:hypothetical protein